jgi:hypothetical protein
MYSDFGIYLWIALKDVKHPHPCPSPYPEQGGRGEEKNLTIRLKKRISLFEEWVSSLLPFAHASLLLMLSLGSCAEIANATYGSQIKILCDSP